jgi:hypothetical protein
MTAYSADPLNCFVPASQLIDLESGSRVTHPAKRAFENQDTTEADR